MIPQSVRIGTMAVFTIEKDYPSETIYQLDTRQTDNGMERSALCWMDNPPDLIHLFFFSSILTDFEDGLSVPSVKTANEMKRLSS